MLWKAVSVPVLCSLPLGLAMCGDSVQCRKVPLCWSAYGCCKARTTVVRCKVASSSLTFQPLAPFALLQVLPGAGHAQRGQRMLGRDVSRGRCLHGVGPPAPAGKWGRQAGTCTAPDRLSNSRPG